MQCAGALRAGERATLAQSAEQALRKRQVIGSIPMGGSSYYIQCNGTLLLLQMVVEGSSFYEGSEK